MGKVTMIGTFTCKDGKAEETDAVLAAMVEAARHEPGVEIYSYHRGEGNTYWFFALMADGDSMEKHGQTDAMRAAIEAFDRWPNQMVDSCRRHHYERQSPQWTPSRRSIAHRTSQWELCRRAFSSSPTASQNWRPVERVHSEA
jgi:quinol monooxygenase YgiN